MAGEDEYVYRLGIDYRDLDRALNNVLTMLGKIDAGFAKVPASAQRQMTQASKATANLSETIRKAGGKVVLSVDDSKAIAAEKRQKNELAGFVKQVREAEDAYAKFQRNQARGLQRPGGLQPARLTNARLAELQQQNVAARASGVTVNGAFVKAINDEIKARADAKQASADAAAAKIKDAERVRAAEVEAAAAATRADEKHYAQGVAAADAATEKRIRSKRAEVAAILAAERQEQEAAAATQRATDARRNAPVAGRLQAVRTYESAGISPTYRPLEFSSGRNTAAQNTLTPANQQDRSAQAANALRQHYQEAERAQAAQERLNAKVKDYDRILHEEYSRQLPRFRYALYDVSNAARIGGAVLVGTAVAATAAVVGTAASYQDLYANVQRTSDILTDDSLSGAEKNGRFAQLRQDLVDLSKQIPVTFADITKIATLGNQLGIGANNITSFTETVAKFSRTTGVSVEESATAFGRLGELLNNTDYRQIGDQIAYLGVRSVATEKEIIDTTTQLAVSLQSLTTLQEGQTGYADQVKETTKATLALSTTVAGLGVRPEQARGTFIRAFGAIGAAVSSGGAALNDLGRISALGSEQFRANWEKGGESAYTAFLQFTRGLGDNTTEINGNLKALGITAVRDRQTLGLLAQNGTRALDDLANASKGASNDFLDKSFGVQTATLISQFQLLKNQVAGLFDTIGGTTVGPLTVAVNILQRLVGLVDSLAHNPAAAFGFVFAAGLTAAVGAAFLLVSAGGRLAANTIALQQLFADTAGSGGILSGVWAAMTGNAARLTLNSERLAAALAEEGVAQEVATRAAARYNTVAATTPVAAGRAAGAATRLAGALGKVGIYGSIAALLLMTPAFVQAIKDWTDELRGAVPEADALALAVENLGNKGADAAQKTISNGFQAFGSKQLPTDALFGRNTGRSQDPLAIPGYAGLGTPGFRSKTLITAGQAAVNQVNTNQSALAGQQVGPGADVALAVKELQNADAAIASLFQNGNTKGANELLAQLKAAMGAAGVSGADLENALKKTKQALGATGDETLDLAIKNKGLADSESTAADAFSSVLDTLFSTEVAAQKVAGDFLDLGKAVRKGGADTALTGALMRTAIEDIYASTDDALVAKGRLQSLFEQLAALGYTVPQLAALRGAIDSISGVAANSAVDISSFTNGVNGIGDSADDSAAKVRTLVDYGNDLQSTFGRAFDLRFGRQEALDAITKGFRDAKDAIADTREELRKAKADLAENLSDQSTTEYQLGIAQRYGDSEAVQRLSARLQQQQAEEAEKRRAVRDARTANDRTLTGNGAAAVANRATLLPLIQNGQSYLQSLAAGGASREQLAAAAERLKKQFVDQAVQMGYTRKDAETLAGAYDDMKTIIGEIPRNITTKIKSNAGPAKTALAEYTEALRAADGTEATTTVKTVFTDADGAPLPTSVVGRIFADDQKAIEVKAPAQYADDTRNVRTTTTPTAPSVPGTAAPTGVNIPGITGIAAGGARATTSGPNDARLRLVLTDPARIYPALWETFKRRFGFRGDHPTGGYIAPWITQVKAAGRAVPKGYREGGYTGDGPRWQTAGEVHGQEYVLNAQATRLFPRAMLDAANAGVAPVVPRVTATATIGSGATMSLGRTERELLARGGGSLTVVGDRIAQAFDEEIKRSARRGAA